MTAPVIRWWELSNLIEGNSEPSRQLTDTERLNWLEAKMREQALECPRFENGVFVSLSQPGSGTGLGVLGQEFPTLRQAIDHARAKEGGV